MEAYSRYTDPGRFQPLHPFAWRVIRQLEDVFGVVHHEVKDHALEEEAHGALEQVVGLAPADPTCAAIAIGYTSFPGLVIHCGHRLVERFPSCGCDACGETADSEAYRFEEVIVAVTQGSFREVVEHPLVGPARYGWDLAIAGSRSGARRRVSRSEARRMMRQHGRSTLWQPWPEA